MNGIIMEAFYKKNIGFMTKVVFFLKGEGREGKKMEFKAKNDKMKRM